VTRHLSALLALCVCAGLPCPSAAQEGAPLTVLLKPSGPRSQHAQACELTLQRSLLQAGLEVMAAPPPGELERLARAIGETDEAPPAGAMTGASLVISYQLLEQADGGRRNFRLSLEARAPATAQLAGSAVETSAPFAGGPGQAMRALDEVCEAGGASIAKQLQGYQQVAAQDGGPIRIVAKNGPKQLSMVLNSALKKVCSRVSLKLDDGKEVSFSCLCKADPLELAAALDETLRAKFPRAKYVFGAKQRDLILIVFTP